MVTGLETFVRFFADFKDCYVLIGGSACDLQFSAVSLPFRATRDLDMVLCVEALTPDFFRQFWQFVRDGGYRTRERSDGARQFYRFAHPSSPGFPVMMELFSRKADVLPPDAGGHLTPIPAGEEASSLSAILLDDLYYGFVMRNRTEVDGWGFGRLAGRPHGAEGGGVDGPLGEACARRFPCPCEGCLQTQERSGAAGCADSRT